MSLRRKLNRVPGGLTVHAILPPRNLMQQLALVLAARIFVALLGLFCVLTAIVLYPNEEGKIQSKFEDFWVKAHDYQRLALSRHAAFMTQVAKLESTFLDQVFGPKLFSFRSIVVSCWSSTVSFFLAGSVLTSVTHMTIAFPNPFLVALLIGLSLASIACILLPNHRLARGSCLFIAAAIIEYVGIWFVRLSPKIGLETWIIMYLALFVGGFCCDVIFIAATRRLVRWAGTMARSLTIVGVLTCNLLLAVALVVPGLVWQRASIASHFVQTSWWFVIPASMTVGLSNLFDFLFASLFVALAAVLLIHRALWPLLTRTLFKMQDIGTKGRRAILLLIGIALLGVSGAKFPELVKELVQILGKA
jgi:hypothetical protein